MGYVIVIFGEPNPDYCDLNRCPMHAIGPYATNDEAKAEADKLPEWMRAHVLDVRERA